MDKINFKDVLPPLVDNFSGNILAYAVLLAAIATITMSLLELFKAIFKLRPFYNRLMFRRWIRRNTFQVEASYFTEIYSQFLILAVTDTQSANALFDQPTEKMMGLIQATANLVLDYPNEYPHVYNCLTKANSNNKTTVDKVQVDAMLWRTFSEDVNNTMTRQDIAKTSDDIQKATQARSRLDHFVNRKLDAFQTKNDFFWTRLNQIVAITGAAIFIAVLLASKNVPYVTTFFLSIFGGMISPFAKDIVSALSGLSAKKK